MELIGVAFMDERPSALPLSERKIEYCGFVALARRGEDMCAPLENITCPMARYHLRASDDAGAIADQHVRWGTMPDRASADRFVASLPRLAKRSNNIVCFRPPRAEVQPDLVIAVCSPAEAQKLLRRHLPMIREALGSPVIGVGEVCVACTSCVLTNGQPVISVACNGSRKWLKLADGEMLMSAPRGSAMYDMLMEIAVPAA